MSAPGIRPTARLFPVLFREERPVWPRDPTPAEAAMASRIVRALVDAPGIGELRVARMLGVRPVEVCHCYVGEMVGSARVVERVFALCAAYSEGA